MIFRIFNLALRGITILARFLLIIYMAKYFSIEELGEYGLFVTTITISMFVLGLDFYTYNTRKIIGASKNNQLHFIRDQFVFHLLIYIIILPLILLVFLFNIIDIQYIFLFYIILVLEHLSQELYRLYTTLAKPLFANVLLFLRMALWIYVLVFVWLIDVNNKYNIQNLYSIYVTWALGVLLSVIIGFYYLSRLYNYRDFDRNIDWQWIKKGIYISIPFLIGTIAYKIIELSDRYMIDYYMTKVDVGIYTFFSSIANTIQSVVFASVIMLYYPKMLKYFQNNDTNMFIKISKRFFIEVIIYSILCIVGIIILIGPLLHSLGKVEFINHLYILWILLGGVFLLNLSFVYHYMLFANQEDIYIRNITILGAIINIILNIILIPLYGLSGAGIATLLSFLCILMSKYYFSKSIVR